MFTQCHGDLEHRVQALTPRPVRSTAGVERSRNLIEVATDRCQLRNRTLESGELLSWLLRVRQVKQVTGLSRMTLYRLELAGEFPQRRQLSKNCNLARDRANPQYRRLRRMDVLTLVAYGFPGRLSFIAAARSEDR